MPKADGPIRTCVGCRRRDRTDRLVRVSFDKGELVLGRVGAGRGAWLCRSGSGGPEAGCVRLALRRGSIERGLRRTVGASALQRFADAWASEVR